MPTQFTISLSTINMRELPAESNEDAWDVINRRRFIRAWRYRCSWPHFSGSTRLQGESGTATSGRNWPRR